MAIECNICVESIETEQIVTTKCGHLYHEKCILEWLKQSGSCPTCRVTMRRTSLRKVFITTTRNEIGLDDGRIVVECNQLRKEIETLKVSLDNKEQECIQQANKLQQLIEEKTVLMRLNAELCQKVPLANVTNNHRPIGNKFADRYPTNKRYAHVQSVVADIWKK